MNPLHDFLKYLQSAGTFNPHFSVTIKCPNGSHSFDSATLSRISKTFDIDSIFVEFECCGCSLLVEKTDEPNPVFFASVEPTSKMFFATNDVDFLGVEEFIFFADVVKHLKNILQAYKIANNIDL